MAPLIHVTTPLETERLLLRPFMAEDLDVMADIRSRPEVARYLYWEPEQRRQTKAVLKRRIGLTRIERESDNISLAVCLRPAAPASRHPHVPMIGHVLLTYASAVHQQAEVGYIFHPDVQGHGYATEAVAALVDLAFGSLRVHRVFAHLDARNVRSAKLLERLGMRREAHLVQNEWVKGEWTDDVTYAVLADEWSARRADRRHHLPSGTQASPPPPPVDLG